MMVLKEANEQSNILLISVSDHFELCLAKCRTNSRYEYYTDFIIVLSDDKMQALIF